MSTASTLNPATSRQHTLASRSIAGLTVSDNRYTAGCRQRPHSHSFSSITLLMSGAVEERAPSATRLGRPRSVMIKPAGTVHSNVWGPAGTRTLQIAWQEDTSRDEPWARAFHEYRWIEGGPLAATMTRMYGLFARTEFSAELALEEFLCEIASLIDALDGRATQDCPGTWLDRVYQRLCDLAVRPPTVSELAAEAGVHPVYLARAFRRRHRCSIRRFLRRQRVGAVCERLAMSSAPIASIALATGFADQPHLCRVFRAEMGTTPAVYRKVTRGD